MSKQTSAHISFDVIVAGVGSMGAPACYYLAKRGCKVLGLEQFDISHEFGSHAGQSRIIRKAYFEHPDYVPLLQRAYKNWEDLENETGEQVYYQTGLVYFGHPGHPMIKGVNLSAGLYNLPLEKPGAADVKKRFPRFDIPANYETLFEPEAGFVTPEKAIKLYATQAIKRGAEIHTNEKVTAWKKEGDDITVTTNKGAYHCRKLVLSAGAWSGKIIPGFQQAIKVTRQFVAWIHPHKPADFTMDKFPCWLIADDERPGCYYGFPVLPAEKFGVPHGLKIAHHHPATVTDPDKVNRAVTEEDMENLRYVLDKYLPGTFSSLSAAKVCLYGNSPDEDFIIDKLPGYENKVVIACGFSGHGFKFASAVGEILADLAIEGRTLQPIGFLSVNRFLQTLIV